MEIWLVRHTRPAVAPGTCYGWTDVPLADSFEQEAQAIRGYLPDASRLVGVWSSTLSRCTKLAQTLYPEVSPELKDDLREMHFGDWENRNWNDIPEEESATWMRDFVQEKTPNGECYEALQQRVLNQVMPALTEAAANPLLIVSHSGVMRSLLAHLLDVPLVDSFRRFHLDYGAVIRLELMAPGRWKAHYLHQCRWNGEAE